MHRMNIQNLKKLRTTSLYMVTCNIAIFYYIVKKIYCTSEETPFKYKN